MASRTSRDLFGSLLGILVFLAGVALLLIVFTMAHDMFGVPADQALKVHAGKTLDLNITGAALGGIVIRIVLLLVMAVVASLVANRGITLYSHCKGAKHPVPAPENLS